MSDPPSCGSDSAGGACSSNGADESVKGASEAAQANDDFIAPFSEMSGDERVSACGRLLSHLSIEQLLAVKGKLEELLKIDFLGSLPESDGIRILRSLDLSDLASVSLVSKTYRRLALSDCLWKEIAIRRFGEFFSCSFCSPLSSRWVDNFQFLRRGYFLRQDRLLKNGSFVEPGVYRRFIVGIQFDERKLLIAYPNGWFRAHRAETGEFLGEWKAHIDTILQFQFCGCRLVSCGYEGTVKEWNLKAGTCVGFFTDRDPVSCLHFVDSFDDFCLSKQKSPVGADENVQLLRAITYDADQRLRSPRVAAGDGSSDATPSTEVDQGIGNDLDEVERCSVPCSPEDVAALSSLFQSFEKLGWTEEERIQFYPYCFPAKRTQLLVTGHRSGDVKIRDLRSSSVLVTIKAHLEKVTGVKFLRGTRFLITCGEFELKSWDMDSGKQLGTFLGHRGEITCFDFNGSRLVSADNSRKLLLWDLRRAICTNVLDLYPFCSITSLQVFGGTLVTIHPDRQAKVICLSEFRIIRTLEIEEGVPSCLQFTQRALLIGTMNGRVVRWRPAPASSDSGPKLHSHGAYGLHSRSLFHPHPSLPHAGERMSVDERILRKRRAENGVVCDELDDGRR